MAAFESPDYHECVQNDNGDVGQELHQEELHPDHVDLHVEAVVAKRSRAEADLLKMEKTKASTMYIIVTTLTFYKRENETVFYCTTR